MVEAVEGGIPALRVDGAIEVSLSGASKKPCQVTVVTWVRASKGRRVGLRIPDATFTLTPKRGKLVIGALCPYSEYTVTVEQEGKTGEVKIDSISEDRNSEEVRKTGAWTAYVSLALR